MTSDVSNYDDTIDTRDAQATIDRLFPWKVEDWNGEQQDEYKTEEEAQAFQDEHPEWYVVQDESESDLLDGLLKLRDQVDGSEWDSGATLIRDSYFKEYAQQYADDIHGSAVRDATWPFDHIDWDDAADALQADYTGVDFSGETYWVR